MNSGIRRLLPWLPCVAALLAIISSFHPAARGLSAEALTGAAILKSLKFVIGGGLWVLAPLILGAIFLHYNQRTFVRWLLILFLAGNLLLWSVWVIHNCLDEPYAGLGFIFYPLLNDVALLVIFLFWFAINSWEILSGD